MNKLEAGEFTVKMDIRGATHLESRLSDMFKRIELGLIIFALILAATIIYVSEKSMGMRDYIFVLVLILLFWIFYNFFKSTIKKYKE